MSDKSPSLAGLISIVVVVLMFGGWSVIKKYIQRQTSHEKLTTVIYNGDWSFGEYRECLSSNIKTQDEKPELDCADTLVSGKEKIFKVSFSGDLTYDDEKPESEVHHWMCRRNNADPSFSCSAKPTEKSPESATPTTSEPASRELTDSEIEKRNECEQRFYNKKIYVVDNGTSVWLACEQNPDRLP